MAAPKDTTDKVVELIQLETQIIETENKLRTLKNKRKQLKSQIKDDLKLGDYDDE